MASILLGAQGLTLFHEVPVLGQHVAEEVAALIRKCAGQGSLVELPPITLMGSRWDEFWSAIRTLSSLGEAGPSKKAECLALVLPDRDRPPSGQEEPHPVTIEGLIAHEMTHLRWGNLRHGPEFNARVLALLAGAQFTPRGNWSATTHRIMREKRKETKAWLARTIGSSPRRLPTNSSYLDPDT